MTASRLLISEKRLKKDGTTPVYAIVHIDNKTIKINTGVSVAPVNYDNIKARIRGTSKKVKDDNLIIDHCLALINDILVRYRIQNKKLTADLFLKEYHCPSRYIDFYEFMDGKLKERLKNKEISNVSERHQRVTLNKLKEFKPSLMISEIDIYFINNFRGWLRTKKANGENTIQKTLAYLKIYLNIAVQEKIIQRNPFEFVTNRRIQTQRFSLTEEELLKLMKLYDGNKLSDTLHHTLRHFIFMCLTGIRISDFIRLKKENLQHGALRFIPHKTRTKKQVPLYIPLVSKASQLIADENSQLPLLFNTLPEQKYNDYLKEIMLLVGINKPITNHSARHTFATLFLEKTDDVATLQRILGHTDIKDTMLYVHISTKKICEQMDTFNRLMDL